jgi:hypothetical protein
VEFEILDDFRFFFVCQHRSLLLYRCLIIVSETCLFVNHYEKTVLCAI